MASDEFPCKLTFTIPFPTPRLAQTAHQALGVDKELSPLVRRAFELEHGTVLKVFYSATTNRMLRVSVNGFLESLGVVLEIMQELDVDVVGDYSREMDLKGVQGLVTS